MMKVRKGIRKIGNGARKVDFRDAPKLKAVNIACIC